MTAGHGQIDHFAGKLTEPSRNERATPTVTASLIAVNVVTLRPGRHCGKG
jgi:hypothetical protein